MGDLRCPLCGEKYSQTYRKCPFCQEDAAIRKGKQMRRFGGRRLSKRKRSAGAGSVLLAVLLVVAFGAAGFFLFGDQVASYMGIRLQEDQPIIENEELPPSGEGQEEQQFQQEELPADPQEDPEGGSQTEDPPAVAGPLTLDHTVISIPSGETARLMASGGSGSVEWSCSNENIATVKDGAVTGVAGGTVVITARSGEEEATCTVTVTGDPWVSAAQLSLNRSDFTIRPGDPAFQLKIKGEHSGEVTWTSSNSAVAEVSETGLVSRGSKKGNATITASVDGHVLECIVRVS